MLKITTQSDAELTRLVLEGRLAGPWVEELARCWREVAGSRQSPVVVDLSGVTFIDPEGKAILAKMSQQGAKFHAAGCLTRCIVDEISRADCPESSRSSRKDKREGE
ncbi:MAG: hypothetical protein E6K63_11425 [Nitrospirae bacterium]|nr:MAG: hypothetical protein E6K63_11425 [Nitrospirota bacterium]